MAEEMEQSPSLGVVYFGVGFTLAAGVSMVALMVARPWLVAQGSGVALMAMVAPLPLGVLFGGRLAYVGVKHRLRLGGALKRAVGLG